MRILYMLTVAAILGSAVSMVIPPNSSQSSTAETGPTLTACTGANVSINWNVDVPPGGKIVSATWLFEGSGKKNVTLAALISDKFIPQVNSFHLTYLPNVSIQLYNVTSKQSGRYYVTGQQLIRDVRRSLVSFEKTASLIVSETDPVLKGQKLNITVRFDVRKDDASNGWTAFLFCGPFPSKATPPVLVTWKTPIGNKIKGAYDDATASFVLPLGKEITSGNYVCHVDMLSNITGCSADRISSLRTQAQLHIDDKDLRLRLLENDYSNLTEQLGEDAMLLDKLANESESLDQHQKVQLEQTIARNEQQEIHLKQQDTQLSEAAGKIANAEKQLAEQLEKATAMIEEQSKQLQEGLKRNAEQDKQIKEETAKIGQLFEKIDELVEVVENEEKQGMKQPNPSVIKSEESDKQLGKYPDQHVLEDKQSDTQLEEQPGEPVVEKPE